jgi:hypothetical protein
MTMPLARVPLTDVGVVVELLGLTVIERLFVAVIELASVTSAVKLNGLPVVVVGVPVMAPVEAFRLNPPGRAPLDTLHVKGVVPPVAVSVCE